MKTFRRISAARKAANGQPFIQIGSGKHQLFVVLDGDLISIGLTEVSLICPRGGCAGRITMKHLDRLGNGNWAETKRPTPYNAFPSEEVENLPGCALARFVQEG